MKANMSLCESKISAVDPANTPPYPHTHADKLAVLTTYVYIITDEQRENCLKLYLLYTPTFTNSKTGPHTHTCLPFTSQQLTSANILPPFVTFSFFFFQQTFPSQL